MINREGVYQEVSSMPRGTWYGSVTDFFGGGYDNFMNRGRSDLFV